MIPGCSQSKSETITPALDLAPYRCPDVPARDRQLFARGPEEPPKGALKESALKRWVDGLELQIEARNAAGRRIIREYDHCRGKVAATS